MLDFKPLDRLLRQFTDDGLPGCSCVIARYGETLYEGYYGHADVEQGIALNASHVFRQASLTKVALYTLAMMLFERGAFTMNDPISSYFPEWAASAKLITRPDGSAEIVPTALPIVIRDIMTMTCGLPYQFQMPGGPPSLVSEKMAAAVAPLAEAGRYSLREHIRVMAQVPLSFEPGTRWLYGFASELIAGLVETICGIPAEESLQRELYEPLGMTSTSNYLNAELRQRLVKNYYLASGKNLGEPDALTFLSPAQDAAFVGEKGTVNGFSRMITNAADFSHLMQMLACGGKWQGERLMGRKTIDLMRQNVLSDELIRQDFHTNYLAGYGYGYGVRTLLDRYAGQSNGNPGSFGWTGGSGTWAEADPSEGVSVVYMHNLQPNLEEYHHLRLRTVAYGCL